MLRRTFLTLLGAVAWPWRKADNRYGHYLPVRRSDLSGDGKPAKIQPSCDIPPGLYHGPAHFVVRNVSGQRIEAGTLVKFVPDDNGVIPV